MITIMSNPLVLQGAVEPAVVPTRMAAASAAPAHKFFNVIRDLVSNKHGYHTENEVLAALNAITSYEKQVISAGDLQQVTDQNDRAAFEDVSKRIPPGNVQPSAVLPQGIDYRALASMLMQLQQEAQAGPPEPVS